MNVMVNTIVHVENINLSRIFLMWSNPKLFKNHWRRYNMPKGDWFSTFSCSFLLLVTKPIKRFSLNCDWYILKTNIKVYIKRKGAIYISSLHNKKRATMINGNIINGLSLKHFKDWRKLCNLDCKGDFCEHTSCSESWVDSSCCLDL